MNIVIPHSHIAIDNAHMYSKEYNSRFNHYRVVLFQLRNLCNLFLNGYNSITFQDIHVKLGTHIARDNTHMYSNILGTQAIHNIYDTLGKLAYKTL